MPGIKEKPVSLTLSPQHSHKLRNRAEFVGHEPAAIVRALVSLYLNEPENFERHRDSRGAPVFTVQGRLSYAGASGGGLYA